MAKENQIQPRVVLEKGFYSRLELLCPAALSKAELIRYYLNVGYVAQLATLGVNNPSDVASHEISMAEKLGDDLSEEWTMDLIRSLMRMQDIDHVDLDTSDTDAE